MIERLGRWPWHYKSKPRYGQKRVMLNCVIWNAVWMPTSKAERRAQDA